MAFTLEVIRGNTTYSLNDGNPFRLERADSLGGASIRTIEEKGPFQHGSSHLDFRLEPRTISLSLLVVGSSASTLDGYRDTLQEIFKPVEGFPIILKLTRDDGEVRQIDCQRTGPADTPLIPTNRPGNIYRSVILLRGSDPTWYNPDEESVSFSGPNTSWWTGYSTIGTANAVEKVGTPAVGQLWAWTGTVQAGSPWTVAFRGGSPVHQDLVQLAFSASGTAHFMSYWIPARYDAVGGQDLSGNIFDVSSGAFMTSGTHNYIMGMRRSGGTAGTLFFSRDGVILATDIEQGSIFGGFRGTATRWRSAYNNAGTQTWGAALQFAAGYNIGLDDAQIVALSAHMTNGTAGSVFTQNIVYEGDFETYPVIYITGPITSPVITSATTGDVLDFTGGTIGSTDIWTVDTRYGRKSVTNSQGSSVAQYLSENSNLATFKIVPAPIAAGGTNTFTVSGSASGTATTIEITYLNRYLSF